MGKQTVVVVKIYREIQYPKAMLNKEEPFVDAMNKAYNDMENMFHEIINNDHDVPNMKLFKIEAREELSYKYRKAELEEKSSETISIVTAAKALATKALEEKYGELSHEQNPGLYVFEPELIDDQKHVIRPGTWYMRLDIENEFYALYDGFKTFLRQAAKKQ